MNDVTRDGAPAPPSPPRNRVSVPEIAARKRAAGSAPIVMVTAYDTPGARIVDAAGADVILVGDSVANTVLGHADTLSVGIDDMVHHTAAAARARPAALLVGDMPWLSYHLDTVDAVRNAAALVRSGADAVKLEGGLNRIAAVSAIVNAEIPVMGHLGLTPQSIRVFGGFKVQAREGEARRRLLEAALSLEAAGVFALVLECVPVEVATEVTAKLRIPTIGIGAGPDCDGQVLVFHDILGIGAGVRPRFVRRYAEVESTATRAIAAFAGDVRAGRYPSEAEWYR